MSALQLQKVPLKPLNFVEDEGRHFAGWIAGWLLQMVLHKLRPERTSGALLYETSKKTFQCPLAHSANPTYRRLYGCP